ncbi:MAG: 5'/3'-nucleotidase SurE [Clostridia bacterium]
MNILVVNDDGIHSHGIKVLARKLMKYGKVYVVAPHTEQSAVGHGITIHNPMRLHVQKDFLEGIEAWSLDGKPADCVKFALYGLHLPVDLVVSGINNGPNLGTDIIYSGTLAGASEAVICGIPAIAISTDFNHFALAEEKVECVLDKIIDMDILDREVVINVNFPRKEFNESKGIRITEQGLRPFIHEYEQEVDAFWAKGTWESIDSGIETDVYAYENGYISITPIQINRTDYAYMEKLKEIFR